MAEATQQPLLGPGKKQECGTVLDSGQGSCSHLWDPLPGSGNGALSSGCALVDFEF